jgi:hypothetical protein
MNKWMKGMMMAGLLVLLAAAGMAQGAQFRQTIGKDFGFGSEWFGSELRLGGAIESDYLGAEPYLRADAGAEADANILKLKLRLADVKGAVKASPGAVNTHASVKVCGITIYNNKTGEALIPENEAAGALLESKMFKAVFDAFGVAVNDHFARAPEAWREFKRVRGCPAAFMDASPFMILSGFLIDTGLSRDCALFKDLPDMAAALADPQHPSCRFLSAVAAAYPEIEVNGDDLTAVIGEVLQQMADQGEGIYSVSMPAPVKLAEGYVPLFKEKAGFEATFIVIAIPITVGAGVSGEAGYGWDVSVHHSLERIDLGDGAAMQRLVAFDKPTADFNVRADFGTYAFAKVDLLLAKAGVEGTLSLLTDSLHARGESYLITNPGLRAEAYNEFTGPRGAIKLFWELPGLGWCRHCFNVCWWRVCVSLPCITWNKSSSVLASWGCGTERSTIAELSTYDESLQIVDTGGAGNGFVSGPSLEGADLVEYADRQFAAREEQKRAAALAAYRELRAQQVVDDLLVLDDPLRSEVWACQAPPFMRWGGANSEYVNLGGDFNGDGKADVASISRNAGWEWGRSIVMSISTGHGFDSELWPAEMPRKMREGNWRMDYRQLVGDFNGDGLDDIATVSRNGGGGWADWVAISLSTGSGFDSHEWRCGTPRNMRNGNANSDYQHLVGDFNGDGVDDIATVSRNAGGGWADSIGMELSTGDGFAGEAWRCKTPGLMRSGGAQCEYRYFVGDFNGDGRDDIATYSRNGAGGWVDRVAVELSTGSGFESCEWAARTPGLIRAGGWTAIYQTFVGDFNGDGLADLATVSQNAGGEWTKNIVVEFSTGEGFESQILPATTPVHMRNGNANSEYRCFADDFNGDGMTDIATLSRNGGGAWRNWVVTEYSTGMGFASREWYAETPIHIRNGNWTRWYHNVIGDFNGDGTADIATVTGNGGGGWGYWIAMELFEPPQKAPADAESEELQEYLAGVFDGATQRGLHVTVRTWDTRDTSFDAHPRNLGDFRRSFGVESVLYQGVTERISFRGDGEPFTGRRSLFTTQFRGFIYAPENGTYHFAVDGDDAVAVLIDGKEVASWYWGHGFCNNWSHWGRVGLTKGYHRIELVQQENGGGDGISVAWQKPGVAGWSALPLQNLYFDETAWQRASDPGAVNLPDPVCHWKLDDTVSGNYAYDSSGRADGSLRNGPTTGQGVSGNALFFDGRDDYVDLGHSSALKPVNDMTITMWIKPAAVQRTHADIMGGHQASQGWVIQQWGNDHNRYCFTYYSGGFQGWCHTVGTKIPADTWSHFAVQKDGNRIRHYLNGKLVVDTAVGGGNIGYAALENLYLGNGYYLNHGRFFKGGLDDVRLYDSALSAAQIEAVMQDGKEQQPTGDLPDLVAYWPLDDTKTTGQAIDWSGGEVHGRVLNSPQEIDGVYGKALYFDGADDLIDLSCPARIKSSGDLTIAFWINPARTQRTHTDIMGGHQGNQGWTIQQHGNDHNRYSFLWRCRGQWVGWNAAHSTKLPADQWSHFAVQKAGNRLRHYLNGNLVLDVAVPEGDIEFSPTETLYIGNGYYLNHGRYFRGGLDDIRMYGRALTAAEVKAVMNNQYDL